MEISLYKQFLVILLLTVGNGIFSMLEMSIVSSHQSRLESMAEEGNKSAKIVLKLRENPNKMFSTVQFGMTLVSLLTGVYGGTEMAGPLSQYVKMVPGLEPYAYTISMVTIVVVITYLTLILGELVPKRIAIDSPEKIACLLARPMLCFSKICTPLVWILSASTSFVTKIIGADNPEVLPVTADEIRLLLEQGAESGAFDKEEPKLVERVFRLSDMDAGDIMTNRTQMDWIDLEDEEGQIMNDLLSFHHINVPVCRGSIDEFVGIVSLNKVFNQYYRAVLLKKNVSIRFILEHTSRSPEYIPESMDIMKVVHLFQEKGIHEAAVLDEYGNLSGILSVHDILEKLVGIMPVGEEEKAEEANKIVQRAVNEWLIDGLIPIEEFKDFFKIDEDLPGEEEDLYKTLGGLVVYGVGRIPRETDVYEWKNYRFEVVDMDNLRVDKILVTHTPEEENEENT